MNLDIFAVQISNSSTEAPIHFKIIALALGVFGALIDWRGERMTRALLAQTSGAQDVYDEEVKKIKSFAHVPFILLSCGFVGISQLRKFIGHTEVMIFAFMFYDCMLGLGVLGLIDKMRVIQKIVPGNNLVARAWIVCGSLCMFAGFILLQYSFLKEQAQR